MSDSPESLNEALTIQLLEWIERHPRPYTEVLDVWKTSCPRLSIWEDACIAGLIDTDGSADRIVRISPKGSALLQSFRERSFPSQTEGST